MASVELELRWQIVEAKAEERTYKQFVEEQIIDCMNDYLKDVKAKHTSIQSSLRHKVTVSPQ